MKKVMFEPAQLRLSDVEKSYIAGIIDGEGYIGIYRSKDRYLRPVVNVANTSEVLIDQLRRMTGIGAKYKKTHHMKSCWSWSVRKFSEIRGLLEAVLPFLVVKRKKAELLLEFLLLREEAYERWWAKLPRDERGRFGAKRGPVPYSEAEQQICHSLTVRR